MIRRARDVTVGDVVEIDGLRQEVISADTAGSTDATVTTHLCFRYHECFEKEADHPVLVLESAIPDPSNLDAVETFLNTNTNP